MEKRIMTSRAGDVRDDAEVEALGHLDANGEEDHDQHHGTSEAGVADAVAIPHVADHHARAG